MKFILEVFKLSIVVLSGVIILYITEWVWYGRGVSKSACSIPN